MNHYKSWSGLNRQLNSFLCDALKDRITYFLTRYSSVHNAYGRASVRLDGKELVSFSWDHAYRQEGDTDEFYQKTGRYLYANPILEEKWNRDCILSEMDFLDAATRYLEMPIREALESSSYIIRMFAIMDRRIGRATLESIKKSEITEHLPQWVSQFYELRFSV